MELHFMRFVRFFEILCYFQNFENRCGTATVSVLNIKGDMYIDTPYSTMFRLTTERSSSLFLINETISGKKLIDKEESRID